MTLACGARGPGNFFYWQQITNGLLVLKGRCSMSVSMNWDNPAKTILKITFTGEATQEDFITAFNNQITYLDSVPHNVCVLADFREITRMQNILGASGAMSGKTFTNLAGLVVVGTNPILKAVINVWSKLYRKMTMVSTLEEAHEWANAQLAKS
jgi:hypothetical protein